MRKVSNGIVGFLSLILAIIVLIGCTPGSAQVRNNDVNSKKKQFTKIDELGFEEENNDFGPVKSSSNDKFLDTPEETGRYSESYYREKRKSSGELSRKSDLSAPSGSYFQTGIASWYGREFHGKVTASGEKFDMYDFTAAHKTLPFGTIVKISNFENGKSVRVKINDRGPYKDKRIVDLSYNAAKRLDLVNPGHVMVGITILKKGSQSPSYADSNRKERGYVEPVVDDYDNRVRSGAGYGGNYSI